MSEIWIANRLNKTTRGCGTRDDPFDVSSEENFLALFRDPQLTRGESIDWHWMEGIYSNSYWEWERLQTLFSGVRHIGAGPNSTIWKLKGSQMATGGGAVFASDHYISGSGVYDGTIDCALAEQPKRWHCIDLGRYDPTTTPPQLECWESAAAHYDPDREYNLGEAVEDPGYGWFICVGDRVRGAPSPHEDRSYVNWAGDGFGTVWGLRAQAKNFTISNVVFKGWGTPTRWIECFCCSIGSGGAEDQPCADNLIERCTFRDPYMDNKDGATICNCSSLNQNDNNIIRNCLVDLPPHNEAGFLYTHAYSAVRIIDSEARWVENFTYYEPGCVGPKDWSALRSVVTGCRAINCGSLGCLLFHDGASFGSYRFEMCEFSPYDVHSKLLRIIDEGVDNFCSVESIETNWITIKWPPECIGHSPIWVVSGSGNLSIGRLKLSGIKLLACQNQNCYAQIDTRSSVIRELQIGPEANYINTAWQPGYEGVLYNDGSPVLLE